MTEEQERMAVVKEALSWIDTPYHHRGRVKNVGTDCGMLLLEVFERTDLVPHIEVPYYPPDWHLHRSEEKYLGWVSQYATEVTRPPKSGDIVLYRFARCISHGALVIKWPIVIHAYVRQGVKLADAERDANLAGRQVAVFSYWGE